MNKDIRIYTPEPLNIVKIVEHFNYLGRDCVIVTVDGSYPCAYVELKDLETELKLEELENKLEAHWGVNFCHSLKHLIKSNPQFSKDILEKKYIGWDYGHAGDYIEHFLLHFDDDTMYSLQEIEEECKNVISQLNNMKKEY